MNAASPGAARLARYRFLSLLGRSDDYPPKTGPYQDYPYFGPVSLERVRGAWGRTLSLMREGKAPRELGLYVHWPFCPSQCAYCFCSMRVPRSAAEPAAYAAMLRREAEALEDVFAGASFDSLYFGGGTPTFVDDRELDSLLGRLRRSFRLSPDAQVYFEASPATLTRRKLDVLLRHGLNRLTLGIQSLDEGVLKKAGRVGQTRRSAEAAFELAASAPGLVKDVDLVCGIEGQSRRSFLRDAAWAAAKRPEVIHLYGFDPRPQTLFARHRNSPAPFPPDELERTLRLADRLLRATGYRSSRWDADGGAPEPLEERQDGSLRRLGGSVLGLGPTSKSHAFGSLWYEHRPPGDGPLRTAGLPRFFGLESDLQEEMRGYAIRNLCLFGRLSRPAYRRLFGADPAEAGALGERLAELEAWGKLIVFDDEVRLASGGPLERLVWLKHLYSPRVVRSLLRRHRDRWEAFLRDPEPGLRELERLSRTRSLFRVYYAAARAPAAEPCAA